jgi:hypothetical protein
MLFTDLIDQVRIQARQRTQSKIRFRTTMTKVFVRTQAILSILESPERMPQSNLVTDPKQIRELLESIDVHNLVAEFSKGLEVAGMIMTLAVSGPATWERDMHYGRVPMGYLNPTTGKSLEYRTAIFDELFCDDFLQYDWEPDTTRIAPCFRSAGHLLSRSRTWANDFFADKDAQQRYSSMAQEKTISFARRKLGTTFENVTHRKAHIRIFFVNDQAMPLSSACKKGKTTKKM